MSDPHSPAHLLCVYAEPLVSGRRVAVLGDASAGLGERLIELGARSVHVFDPDAARAAASANQRVITTRALTEDFGVRDGAFDVALIPDLASLRDPAAALARLRRALGTEGALLAAAENPARRAKGDDRPTLDYYELYDLVSLQFSSVRMVGQVPFSGVALAELGAGEEEPTVSVQTALIEESEAPEIFIAVASQGDVRLDGYTIVQLPSAPSAAPAVPNPREREADAALLAEARLRAELLASQLEEARGHLKRAAVEGERSRRSLDLENDLVEAQARLEVRAAEIQTLKSRVRELEGLAEGYVIAEGLRGRVRELEAELSRAMERIALLEGAARAAEEAAADLEERAEHLTRIIVARTEEAASLMAELEELRAAPAMADLPAVAPEFVQELHARRQELEMRAAEVERRAVALEAELATVHDAQAAEIEAMEARLRERAQALTEADREIRRRERMVHDLLAAAAEAARATPSEAPPSRMPAYEEEEDEQSVDDELARENAVLRGKLDALALEVARRHAELEARAWRIGELEDALARATSAAPAPPAAPRAEEATLKADLGRARDEIDALRKALAQEHEARVRAESTAESGEGAAREHRPTASES